MLLYLEEIVTRTAAKAHSFVNPSANGALVDVKYVLKNLNQYSPNQSNSSDLLLNYV
jgi:hypothetical protein